MNIRLEYSNKTSLTDSEIEQIITISKSYGDVDIQKWGSKAGALDFVQLIEFSFLYITKAMVDGFIKGFINERYFDGTGDATRNNIYESLIHIKNYLSAYYSVFIANKKDSKEAITIVEQIGDVKLYVVLNSEKSSSQLIDNLTIRLLKVYSYILTGRIEISDPKTIQLYPNFETNTWDYLFIPTNNAFGNFVDKYYDLSNDTYHIIESAEEFMKKFPFSDIDEYKIIISPKNRNIK